MGWAGWKTDNEFFLTEQHEATISDALTCLKSDAPFCFLQSEEESYLDYYKEVLIALLKSESEIELMYFDPKFGDDLAVIVNKELEDIDPDYAEALSKAVKNKLKILCYDCKFSLKGIKLNNKIKIKFNGRKF